MNPRMLSFRQVIEQDRRRWMPFRRMLSKEDQEAFDRMFAAARSRSRQRCREADRGGLKWC